MTNPAEQPPKILEHSELRVYFKKFGTLLANALIARGYSLAEAGELVFLAGAVTHQAIQETAYPDGGEEHRTDDGRLFTNLIPPVQLRLTHHFQEWGGNQLLVMGAGYDAIDKVRPPRRGTQGEMIIGPSQNSMLENAIVPAGYYSGDTLDGPMTVDSDGNEYQSYGDMYDAIGSF